MKKIFQLASLALLAGGMASCSSDEPGVKPLPEGNGGYVAVNIHLPETDGTRSDVDYDEGTADEYKVNTVQLLIFQKGSATKEADYTYVASGLVKGDVWKHDNTANSGVSHYSGNVACHLENDFAEAIDAKETDYYAYVLLNYTFTGGLTAGSTKFSTIQEQVFAYSHTQTGEGETATGGFIMGNMVKVDKDNSYALSQLVKFDPKMIKDSPIAAINAATGTDPQYAVEAYVERLNTKVTVSEDESNGTKNESGQYGTDHGYGEAELSLDKWTLDLTEQTSYLVHNMPEDFTFSDDNASYTIGYNQRAMWGKSVGAQLKNNYTDFADNKALNWSKGSQTPVYSYEHLIQPSGSGEGFDAGFTKDKMTRALIQGTFKNKDNSGTKEAETFVMMGGFYYTLEGARTAIVNDIKTRLNDGDADITCSLAPANDGYVELAQTLIGGNDASKVTDAIWEAIVKTYTHATHNGKNVVYVYNEGKCYYAVYIMHFANLIDDASKKGEYTAKHTGLYSMLRNHWYEIEVNGFAGPGYPGNPPTDGTIDTPDPDKEHYLVTKVNILKWAHHKQTPVLK